MRPGRGNGEALKIGEKRPRPAPALGGQDGRRGVGCVRREARKSALSPDTPRHLHRRARSTLLPISKIARDPFAIFTVALVAVAVAVS